MQPIQLFELATKQAQWLTARQGVVTGNVANANTPGFRAKDVTPFSHVLDNTNMPMARTNPGHLIDSSSSELGIQTQVDQAAKPLISGNSVELADQLMKEGEIKRDYDLNTGIVKAFNRMILATVRR